MECITNSNHSIIAHPFFSHLNLFLIFFIKAEIEKYFKKQSRISNEIFSPYVYICACVFLLFHGPGSFLSYIFQVILKFTNRNICTKYKGADLLWDHIISLKVFLFPGWLMLYIVQTSLIKTVFQWLACIIIRCLNRTILFPAV